MRVLFEAVIGSRAYGTFTEESDYDTRGVGIEEDVRYYLGFSNFEQFEDNTEDTVIFSVKKFFSLASSGNPNILEILYIDDPALIKKVDPLWQNLVLSERNIFLSKKVQHAYLGYAYAQLHRMENHRKWIANPPSEPNPDNFFEEPTKKYETYKNIFLDYDLSRPATKNRLINFIENLKEADSILAVKTSGSRIIVKYKQRNNEKQGFIFNEEKYDAAVKEWQRYVEWRKNRNPERAKLEEESGFDRKHGCHCIRLLDQCEDILKLGTLRVCRPDRVQLWRDIRFGKYNYDEFKYFYDEKIKQIEELAKVSVLPDKVDMKKIESLCIELHKEVLHGVL